MKKEERMDPPGTYVFDGVRSRRGFPLNDLGASLNETANQNAFESDPEAYMDRYGLDEDQKRAVRDRDWLRMVQLGGNVYFIVKIGVTDGMPVPHVIAEMAGMTPEQFAQMMRDGGRKPNG